MRFPRYWTRVSNDRKTIIAKGWSEHSLEDAEQKANLRLERILSALREDRVHRLEHYHYVCDDVICEEVIDRVVEQGEEIGVISRNAYGSLVLNTPCMLIADIDVHRRYGAPGVGVIGSLLSFVGSLFSSQRKSLGKANGKGTDSTVNDPLQQALQTLRSWGAEQSEYSLRVYQTLRGLRVLVTNPMIDVADPQALEILQQWNSDPLYRRLCEKQQCFRARLTPKPWRVGTTAPSVKFPFSDPRQEQTYQYWFDNYVSRCSNYRVCNYLETIGPGTIAERLQSLVVQHDTLCGIESNHPLA